MRVIINPEPAQWDSLCRRPKQDDASTFHRVQSILERVRDGGDPALLQLTQEIDHVSLSGLQVSASEVDDACRQVDASLRQAIETAYERIMSFHQKQLPGPVQLDTHDGICCERRYLPIERVGLYIPGGSAPLFSTLLMLAIPARVAGCRQIILCTPCRSDGTVHPAILYTAHRCGVSQIFKVGGAQAIGAMAYGTESIGRVSKIFGPGNRYVMLAKQLVSAQGTAIDMPAGPSEVMVMADATANPSFVAADLLSQAEHSPDSQSVLLTTDRTLISAVQSEVERQAGRLQRSEQIRESLSHSLLILLNNDDDMVRFANHYAPEHLIISTQDAWTLANQVTAVGSVFVGRWSPESAGDYASGTNHTLPTVGLAAAYSGLGTDSFMHAVTYQALTREGLERLAPTIVTMAQAEGLQAHAEAVKIRLQ